MLWENPNPKANFNAQTIAVDFSTCKYYEIIYLCSSACPNLLSTGKIPKGETTRLVHMGHSNYFREITDITENSISFDNLKHYSRYADSSSLETLKDVPTASPQKIIGYK